MDRRKILQLGAAALAGSIGKSAFAQNATTAGAPAFYLDACSKNLQWRRTPEELAKAVTDLGLHSVDLSIAPAPGHVDPANVGTDLPRFVQAMKAQGVAVRCVTVPISAADSPGADTILAAAADSGVGYYTFSGVAWDEGQPYAAQLSALKSRFAKLAKLNQKRRIKGLYQPTAGMAGDQFTDLLPALLDLDPHWIGVRYDTATFLQTTSDKMERQLRLGGAYIGGVAINDAAVDLEFPKWRQGHFTDAPEILKRPDGSGDNTGNAGGDWLAYGGGGRPLPYRYRPKPVGTGMLDVTRLGKVLKDINFSGPAECQVRYELGGAETGADRITLPQQEVLGRIKRDRITVEQAFHIPWGIPVALPPFLERRERAAAGGASTPAPAGGGGADANPAQ